MDKQQKLASFDPNGVGLQNGHFIGLPFDENDAEVVCISAPWEVTVSYAAGTASGPDNVLNASTQLDLYLREIPDAWKMGLYVRPSDTHWQKENDRLRPIAASYINQLEAGDTPDSNPEMQQQLAQINSACEQLKSWIKQEAVKLLEQNRIVGILGGEHSVPLGLMEAIDEQYNDWSILQIDAHMDLREAYEGFTYSHASIGYHALNLANLKRLVQVGIRDRCEAEMAHADKQLDRIILFEDEILHADKFHGKSWHNIVSEILQALPASVYVSFDIDGLQPYLCPHTGTPVPGGLTFEEALYLIQCVVNSGRKIIGFDLCEVAGLGNDWDGNVGARVLYQLATWAGKSQGRI